MTEAPNGQAHARAKGKEAAEQLLGTCKSLYDLGEEFAELENDTAFCDVLDEAVFCCTQCGWWFGQSAEEHPDTGEWVCEECFTELGGDPEEDV